MKSNKTLFLHVVSLIVVFAVFGLFFTTAEAVTFSTTGDCKDLVNDGIPFTATVSIPPEQTETWRDRIQIVIFDPDGNNYITPGTDNVKEVVLYASTSGGTAYQCQQLTTDAIDNSFSCNSFPKGATISKMSVRFIPNFDGGGALVLGDYKISVLNLNTTLEIFSGTAPVTAASSACAWNQTPAAFTPKNPLAFTYNTNTACGGGGVQTFDFNESATNPFTVVSFPLGESIDPARWAIIASPLVNAFSYTLVLKFDGDDADSLPDAGLDLVYDYTAGTDPANTTINTTTPGAAWAGVGTPVKLVEGSLSINPGATLMDNMPLSVPLTFDVYYKNIDPTIGIQNSTFHFQRNMTMLFAPLCPADPVYITTTPLDPCVTAKQVFSLPLPAGTQIPANFHGNFEVTKTFGTARLWPVYFYVQKCANATCTNVVGSDAYVYRVNVKDPEADNRFYHYAEIWGDVVTNIHMKFFGPVAGTELKSLDFSARTAGTYRVRGFYHNTNPAQGFPNDPASYGLELFVTIPQKGGDATCLSAGQDGAYKAKWDGCKENHDPQTLQFEAINERYGFISNYSNQRLVFNFSPAISTVPMAGNITELYCDWQVLADGYSASGAVCNPDRIELPPMTRAIVKGGKIYLSQRPPMKDGPNEFEYIMAYQRTTNKDNMNLFIDVQYVECPREAIPDTGYSLRSPAPLAQADGSFIFTGNSLQIPAIGLGMDGGVPIVHLNYKDGTLESGWNLKMLGGYIGELEGGAYLPYAGNSVLTGHYYSQGVFVNLVNLRLEDEIIVFGNDGMKYTYSVTNSYWTEPNNVYQLFQPNGDRSLTLVTCDDYNFISDEYQKRYIVQATLVNSEPYQP